MQRRASGLGEDRRGGGIVLGDERHPQAPVAAGGESGVDVAEDEGEQAGALEARIGALDDEHGVAETGAVPQQVGDRRRTEATAMPAQHRRGVGDDEGEAAGGGVVGLHLADDVNDEGRIHESGHARHLRPQLGRGDRRVVRQSRERRVERRQHPPGEAAQAPPGHRTAAQPVRGPRGRGRPCVRDLPDGDLPRLGGPPLPEARGPERGSEERRIPRGVEEPRMVVAGGDEPAGDVGQRRDRTEDAGGAEVVRPLVDERDDRGQGRLVGGLEGSEEERLRCLRDRAVADPLGEQSRTVAHHAPDRGARAVTDEPEFDRLGEPSRARLPLRDVGGEQRHRSFGLAAERGDPRAEVDEGPKVRPRGHAMGGHPRPSGHARPVPGRSGHPGPTLIPRSSG